MVVVWNVGRDVFLLRRGRKLGANEPVVKHENVEKRRNMEWRLAVSGILSCVMRDLFAALV